MIDQSEDKLIDHRWRSKICTLKVTEFMKFNEMKLFDAFKKIFKLKSSSNFLKPATQSRIYSQMAEKVISVKNNVDYLKK